MYAAETTTTPRRRWPPSAIRAQSPLTARSGNDDGGKEAAIEKATSIAAGGLLFLLLLAHCGSSRFIKESSEVARGCPARLPLDLLLHLAHLPTKPRIKYVVFAWLVFLLMVDSSFFTWYYCTNSLIVITKYFLLKNVVFTALTFVRLA